MRKDRKEQNGASWPELIVTAVLIIVIVVGGFCLLMGRNGLALVQGWLMTRYLYVDEGVNLDEVADQALDGMVSGLGDRWSYYLDDEQHESVSQQRANNYVGVGVTVSYELEEGLLVVEVTEDGPAAKAGVAVGDTIIAVDGVSIAGAGKDEATNLIQGEAGTVVELLLLGEDGTERVVTCTRAAIQKPSAVGAMLEDNIGYVKLSNFYSGSALSFQAEIDALIESGAEGLIIDVRGNPGGYVTELVEMLDYLLPEGPVFRRQPRWGSEVVYESDADCIDLPMAVLVNAGSYSAAELLAAQLRESANAPIVGVVTSGKGNSQQTFGLLNDGALGLSTATYCTGGGHSLVGEGILPDVELALSETGDNQLQAAIDLLKNE